MKTNDWKSIEEAKALIIGHDPRLQNSDKIAASALFANYYFKDVSKDSAEKRKYGLAKSTFDQVLYLTNNTMKPEQIYITNLCNDELTHAPKGKTVLIPKLKAEEGINNILAILKSNPKINYIFPMSLQANYWLQKLGFYQSTPDFVENSEPKSIGINNDKPYYEPKKAKTFLQIYGNQYKIENGNQIVIPILHSKNYPLTGNFISYNENYKKIKNHFRV